MVSVYVRRGPENTKVRYELVMGYTEKLTKFQIPKWPGSATSRLVKYAKEILKNTKEKSGNRIFQE